MKTSIKRLLDQIDKNLTPRTFGRFFRLEGSDHEKARDGARLWTEILAGLSTFATMAYIISVNASMLSLTGGTCACPSTKTGTECYEDPTYMQCIKDIKRDLVTATAAISGIATIAFGLLTNLPVALAPGMGLNAYFTYQVVGVHGSGLVPYRTALTAVFAEGFIFILLSLVGLRQYIVRLVPESIKIASGVGIGMFLTEIGLSYSGGIGLITGSNTQPLKIAGCPPQYRNPETGVCDSQQMRNPQLWIGVIFGGFLSAYLMAFKKKLAFVIGIAVVSVISWPRGTSFTYFPYTDDGQESFEFFKKIVGFHAISRKSLAVQDWHVSADVRQFLLALFTFLYVDIIDCTATLYSMARFAGVVDPDSKDFPRSTLAYCTDAFFISVGSLFGVSPVTVFVESGAGVNQGGKTGLTAITTGLCFCASIFFAPIFASIPPWATGCTLILVGCMMMRQVTQINWSYIGDTVPAFVMMAFMPLTYSVAYGLIAGLLTYTAINGAVMITSKLSRGRIQPEDYFAGDAYVWKPAEGPLPLFLRMPTWLLNKCFPQLFKNKETLGGDAKDVEEDEGPALSNSTQFSTFSSNQQPVEMRTVL